MNITELINKLNYEEPDLDIKTGHVSDFQNHVNQILKQFHFLHHFSQKIKWRRLVKC